MESEEEGLQVKNQYTDFQLFTNVILFINRSGNTAKNGINLLVSRGLFIKFET